MSCIVNIIFHLPPLLTITLPCSCEADEVQVMCPEESPVKRADETCDDHLSPIVNNQLPMASGTDYVPYIVVAAIVLCLCCVLIALVVWSTRRKRGDNDDDNVEEAVRFRVKCPFLKFKYMYVCVCL